MQTTVKDENDLAEEGRYLRISYKPTTLMHVRTGDVFVRDDGKPWGMGAVEVSTKADGSHELQRKPSWADPYKAL
ncbi:MAG: hypothetical protein NUW01_03155 [Gemmatimonadaceae bacterium]|nr:hypothetical protein [Gemmatimonadaceae bacterium]